MPEPITSHILPACALLISQFYEVPMPLLEAIAIQEGGGRGVVAQNSNGTYDLGLMQINSVWWEPENPTNLWSLNITKETALYDDCVNVGLSAWILRQNAERLGNDWFLATAAYNAGPHNLRGGVGYAVSVNEILRRRHGMLLKLDGLDRYPIPDNIPRQIRWIGSD